MRTNLHHAQEFWPGTRPEPWQRFRFGIAFVSTSEDCRPGGRSGHRYACRMSSGVELEIFWLLDRMAHGLRRCWLLPLRGCDRDLGQLHLPAGQVVAIVAESATLAAE